jgi:hypothetical protein
MNAWVRAKDVHSTDHFQDQEGRQMKEGLIRSGSGLVKVLLALLLCAGGSSLASAEGPGKADPPMDPPSHHTGDAGPQHPKHGSMGNIGAKLADPTSDLWAIQLDFQGPTFNDGNVNLGSPQLTPDLQVVQNEQASDSVAVILGIRLVMDF